MAIKKKLETSSIAGDQWEKFQKRFSGWATEQWYESFMVKQLVAITSSSVGLVLYDEFIQPAYEKLISR